MTLALAKMLSAPAFRHPLWHVTIALLPLSYICVITLVGGDNLGAQALIGSLVVVSINPGIVSLPQVAMTLRDSGLEEMFAISPLSQFQYALAIGVSRLLYTLPLLIIGIMASVASGVVPLASLPYVLGLLMVSWFIGCLIGFSVSRYVTNVLYVGAVSNMLGLALNVLPPVYYPESLVPDRLRWAVEVVPTTHIARVLRALTPSGDQIETHLPVWVSVSVLAILCAATVVFMAPGRKRRVLGF